MTTDRLPAYEPQVRQICGVDFVFTDYKEPLVQLAGAVPGYMRGTLPVALADGRLPCAFCDPSKTHRGRRRWTDNSWHCLATHVRAAHGMTAREYRDSVGLLQKTALVSASHRAQMSAANSPARREQFAKVSRPNRHRGLRVDDPQSVPEALNKRGVCRDQILAVTKRIAKENGGRVRLANLFRQGVGKSSIRRFFPSLRALCAEAGVTYAGHGEWSDAEMLRAFRELADRLGRTPTQKELGRANRTPSGALYWRRFGGLDEVCRRLGLPSNSPRPVAFGDEIDMLNRYAQSGSIEVVARATHRDQGSISQILAKYGVPFQPVRRGESHRREIRAWAAEMAQRLAS